MTAVTIQYLEDSSFEIFLTRLSIGANQINRIQEDGFTSMNLIVAHFSHNIKGVKDHLSSLKKSLASTTITIRVYFNPIVTNCLLGIMCYFNQASHTYHTIPRIDEVGNDVADLFSKNYQASVRIKLEDK